MIKDLLGLARRRPAVVPATEPLNHIACRELAKGSNYLVKEARAEFSFEVFASLVKGRCRECSYDESFPCESIGCKICTLPCPCKGCKQARTQGLCFTMRSPMEIRLRYALQTTPIFWISNHGPENINPTGLEVIADTIKRFLNQSKSPVVLLDGIEHLIFFNGSLPVLRFLKDVEELTILYNAIFILPVNPMAVEEKELALMERYMKEVDSQIYY